MCNAGIASVALALQVTVTDFTSFRDAVFVLKVVETEKINSLTDVSQFGAVSTQISF